jgi:Flp pilus assembly protein protease CpaA
MIELIIAIIFMLMFSYYDIFNNRIIPDEITYSFLFVGIMIFFAFLPFELMKLVIAIIVFIIGYLLYKIGYLGGADVYAITGLTLLLPLNFMGIPTIIVILLGSMLLTMFYVMLNFFVKSKKIKFEKQDMITAGLWVIGYSALAYMIYNIGQTTIGIIVFFLGILNSLFALIKSNLMDSMIQTIPLDKIIEEDILATDKMDKDFIEKNKIDRLLTKEEINKLRELGVEEVPVYTGLPPYLPFVSIVTILIIVFTLII